MSAWLESGRPAIQEALAAAFNTIDEHARAELQERDRKESTLLEELQQLRTQAAQVNRLQQENESLKEELQRFRQAQRDQGPESPRMRKILGELAPNQLIYSQPAKSHVQDAKATSDLETKYNKLRAKCNALEKSRDGYKSKLRQRNGEIEKWAEGVDSRDKLIESLKKKVAQCRLGADATLEGQLGETGHGDLADDKTPVVVAPVPKRPSPSLSHEQPVDAVSYTTGSTRTSTRAYSEPNLHPVVPDHISGDILKESTDEDGHMDDISELPRFPEPADDASSVVIKVELSSDGPVFVSERSVRKRKHGAEDEPDTRLQRIKSEHSSSGPECVGEMHNFAPTESLDFEEETHIPTPRKRRDLSHDRLQGHGTDAENTISTNLKDRLKHATSVDRLRGPAQGLGLTPPTHRVSALYDSLGRQSRPATPRDQQSVQDRSAVLLDAGVRDLAEDQDGTTDAAQCHVARSRLDILLNSPSVRTVTPIIRPGSLKVQTRRPNSTQEFEDALKVPPPRELPHGKKSTPKEAEATVIAQKSTINTLSPKTTGARKPPKRPSILRDDMPRGRSPNREKAPLRQKPMDMLRPEDFKPNPRYNDGLSYVYDEVNRGKSAAERAALSGCTDPNCCGKTFRSFAEAERSTIGASVTTRAEDIKLLEEYLGDDAYKLGSMTREEKEETWLQAKTWELANRFGKHRQRYARMPSPPGFWSVDFPNTQERAEERRQAEEIRKALVHERYREAMRLGGKWLFRDEEGR